MVQFSTSGVPIKILGEKYFLDYTKRCSNTLEKELRAKGFRVIGDISLPGFNTNVFLKYFGGINRNRPDEEDLAKAIEKMTKQKALSIKNACIKQAKQFDKKLDDVAELLINK